MKKLIDKILYNNSNHPTGDEVFEAKDDVKISYLTHFMAPYTGGSNSTLKKGERIIISKPNKPKPSGYYCYPINEIDIEKRMVPMDERENPKYNGFSLFVDTNILLRKFTQIKLKPITFIKGDATKPEGNNLKIITHICNDIGGWGKGFVVAISNKWKSPEQEYRKWYKSNNGKNSETTQFENLQNYDKNSSEFKFGLGNVQFIKVEEDLWIANMIAQRDIGKNSDGKPPIRYRYLNECLKRVRKFAMAKQANIHMPRIGCGLAGGEWNKVAELINQNLIAYEIDTTVYDFEK